MARRVQLKRFAAQPVNLNNYGAYRLRIEVAAVEGPDLDQYLFIYRRVSPSPYTGVNCDTFEAVCGPPQLAAVPAVEPDPDVEWPYYRQNYVELDVASATQADAIWEELQSEVCVLISALNKLDSLKLLETVWCPSPPDTSASSQSTSI